jgi:uncharacterized protein (DUF2062 family)
MQSVTVRHGPPRRFHSRIKRAQRYVRYHFLIPIFRSPHPPEYTARGVAIGVFWGVTPFLGAQTLLMIATWQVLKRGFGRDSSLVQALAWAWINNPLTMIPMYYAFYVTGLWLTGTSGSLGGYDAFVGLWEESRHAPSVFARVDRLARQVGLALLVGSVPYALLGSWAGYRWALGIVRARRRRIRRAGRASAGRPA